MISTVRALVVFLLLSFLSAGVSFAEKRYIKVVGYGVKKKVSQDDVKYFLDSQSRKSPSFILESNGKTTSLRTNVMRKDTSETGKPEQQVIIVEKVFVKYDRTREKALKRMNDKLRKQVANLSRSYREFAESASHRVQNADALNASLKKKLKASQSQSSKLRGKVSELSENLGMSFLVIFLIVLLCVFVRYRRLGLGVILALLPEVMYGVYVVFSSQIHMMLIAIGVVVVSMTLTWIDIVTEDNV